MGHTCNSIVINAPVGMVFDISNDIPRWTELFGNEYQKAEVTERKGNKITFRLTDEEGKSWVSWRLLFREQGFAYAERHDPLFPFKYMKLVWLYTPVQGGIRMTWIQDFQMDEKAKFTDEQVEGFINEGSAVNLKIFKEIIERESRSSNPLNRGA